MPTHKLIPLLLLLLSGCSPPGDEGDKRVKITELITIKESFAQSLPAYKTLVQGLKKDSLPEIAPERAYLSGRLLPVSRKDTELVIDDSYLYFPQKQLAKQPDQLGTLVWMDFGGKIFQPAVAGDPFLVPSTLEVFAIEMPSGKVIARRFFSIEEPDRIISLQEAGAMRNALQKEAITYLQKLPTSPKSEE